MLAPELVVSDNENTHAPVCEGSDEKRQLPIDTVVRDMKMDILAILKVVETLHATNATIMSKLSDHDTKLSSLTEHMRHGNNKLFVKSNDIDHVSINVPVHAPVNVPVHIVENTQEPVFINTREHNEPEKKNRRKKQTTYF